MMNGYVLSGLKTHGKILGIVLFLLILSLIFFRKPHLPHFTSDSVKVEENPSFNPQNYSLVINRTFSGSLCEVYLSGPSREIVYLGGWDCEELTRIDFKVSDLVSEFDNEAGNYTLLITTSANETHLIEFEVLP